jgi:hypothetical protein
LTQARWTSADQDFWILGESSAPIADRNVRPAGLNGAGTIGARRKLYSSSAATITLTSTIRAAANWHSDEPAGNHAWGAAVTNEAEVPLPAGLTFTAAAGIGDRNGVYAPNPGHGPTGAAVRAQAGIAGHLDHVGLSNTRFDLQVVATHALSIAPREARRPSACEIKLSLTRKNIAPLNLTSSCPGGPGAARVSLHLEGRF